MRRMDRRGLAMQGMQVAVHAPCVQSRLRLQPGEALGLNTPRLLLLGHPTVAAEEKQSSLFRLVSFITGWSEGARRSCSVVAHSDLMQRSAAAVRGCVHSDPARAKPTSCLPFGL